MMLGCKSVFEAVGVDVVFRNENTALWDRAYAQLPFRSVNYLSSAIDYQFSYQMGNGGLWVDLSCVLLVNKKPVAIWPLSIAVKDFEPSLSSQGLPVMPPVFVTGCARPTIKKITADCFEIAKRLSVKHGILKWHSCQPFSDQIGIGDWHLISMINGATCEIRHELYVDLKLSMSEIKSRFRKSFRSLVTTGEKLWKTEILRAPGCLRVWEEFRRLHGEVAGRVTRSLESWKYQHEALAANQGFLVVLRDLIDDRMVGAGYFMCSADEGVYAVAAYDRSLFSKPMGHIVQYRAIEELRMRGCRWYRIGTRCFPTEHPAPNDKELAIASFKQGFASYILPSFRFTHNISACQP